MRLRSYTAATVAEALRLVRDELGPDAMIVATHRGGKGAFARVTAAVEPAAPAEPAPSPARRGPSEALRQIREALAFHGVPAPLAERLVNLAGDALDHGDVGGDPLVALAAALDSRFQFAPLPAPTSRSRAFILVGPPGAGKTATAAKLAARAALGGKRVGVITTDTQRAGGIEQLAAFTKLLGLDIQIAEDAGALTDATLAAQGLDGVVIDTAGAIPYDDGDLERVKALVEAARAECVLVLPAGGDTLEAAEAASQFARVGAKRLLVTRLDAARRLASLLTAAEAGRLAFSDVGITAHIAHGLRALNPVSLARLLLGEVRETEQSQNPSEARTSPLSKAAS
jgi:flagellar biosynthesis protein FlhF